MMSDNADHKQSVPPGAIEEELAEVTRLTARPIEEDKTAQHLSEVAQRIVDGLHRLLGAVGCRLYAVEGAAAPGLHRLAASPIPKIPEPAGGDDPVDRAVRERRIVSALDGGGLVIAVPLLGRDRPVGVLEVHRAHGLWTRDETRLVQIFADHAAIALESARLVIESRQRRRTAEALGLLAHATSRSFEVSTLGRGIVDTLLVLLGCARAALFELVEGGCHLVAVARVEGIEAADDLAGPELGPVEARALRERRLVTTSDFLFDPTSSAGGPGRDGPIQAMLAIPLFHEDTPIGVLSIGDREWRSFGREEIEVFRAAADHAAVALAHARLHAQVAEGVRVRERVRIANELHDTLSQLVFSVGLKLDWCLHRTPPTSPIYPKLEEIHHDAGLMMAQIRQLIGHLSPEGLAEKTFANRLERLLRDFRELTGTAVDLALHGDPSRLTPVAADVLQKTLQEALVNVAKHAHAGQATVRIEIDGDQTSIEVADDGVGFSAEATEVLGARPGHVGLRRMRERIEAVGGHLEIVGRRGSGGVTIRGSFPLRPEGA
jgi:signal transduction histidine kinase